MNGQQQRGPWFWVGIGCLATVAVAAAVVVGVLFLGWRQYGKIKAQVKDPVQREQSAKSLLGIEKFPDGYFPVLSFSVPFLVDITMLGDTPTPVDPDRKSHRPVFKERGFIYVDLHFRGKSDPRLDDFFAGKTDDTKLLEENGINLSAERVLARGVIPGEPKLLFVTMSGRLSGLAETKGPSLQTLALFDCGVDKHRRMGIWLGPIPRSDATSAEPNLTGTVGDTALIEPFMRQFHPCPVAKQ